MKTEEIVEILKQIAEEESDNLNPTRVLRRQWTSQRRIEAINEAIAAIYSEHDRLEK